MPYTTSHRLHRIRREHPVSKEYAEGKQDIDEKTRAALRRIGQVGSAVRWGYLSPSETESEVDEEMHKAMSRIGKKGAAVRWGKIPREEFEEEEVPRISKRRREPVTETEQEESEEEPETELETKIRLRKEAAAKLRRRRRLEEALPLRKRRVHF